MKLAAPPDFSLALLETHFDAYVATPIERRRLHTIYHDTDDFRLARWGCSLRFRCGEGWTLKLPVPHDGEHLVREEHAFAGTGDAVPAGALELATAYLRGERPRPVLELRTLRSIRHVRDDDGDVAELAEDDVRVIAGSQVVQRFREIEIELTERAGDATLNDLTMLLRAAGAGDPDPTPKDVRALRGLAREPELGVTRPTRRAPAGDLVRAALAAGAEALVRLDAQLRIAADARAVHAARVAVRRLRADLRAFARLVDPAWKRRLRDELAWLGERFSAARDADVMLARLDDHLVELPAPDRYAASDVRAPFRRARDEAHAELARTLHDARYLALLSALVDAAKRPLLRRAARRSARAAGRAAVARAWRRARAQVRARRRPPADRDLHAIRIKAKGVRYAAEAVIAALGKRASAVARSAQALQTVLGEQHDAVTLGALLRAHRPANPAAAFIAGELAARETAVAAAARRAWRSEWRQVKRAIRRL